MLERFLNDSSARTVQAWNDSNPTYQQSIAVVGEIFDDTTAVPHARNKARRVVAYLLMDIVSRGLETVKNDPDALDLAVLRASEMEVYGDDSDEMDAVALAIPAKASAPVVVPAAVVVPENASGRGRKLDPNSPLQKAKRLLPELLNQGQDRNGIIQSFQDTLGLKKGTATTYYYICKKELGL